jgi:hypothetical protein
MSKSTLAALVVEDDNEVGLAEIVRRGYFRASLIQSLYNFSCLRTSSSREGTGSHRCTVDSAGCYHDRYWRGIVRARLSARRRQVILLPAKTTPEQIDAWRAAKSETGHLEFKEAKNQFNSNDLLKYCVAIANERGGKLLLGIADKPPRPVVGTKAFPNPIKTSEQIFNKLRFCVDIEEVEHPNGRVLVFHIPSRPIGHPYELDGAYYMRSGESLVTMTPDRLKQIFAESVPAARTEASGRTSSFIGRRTASILVPLVILGFLSLYWLESWKKQQTEPTIREFAHWRHTWFLSTPLPPSGWDTKTPYEVEHSKSFPFVVPGVWIVTGAWDFIVNHRGGETSFNVEIVLTDVVKRKQVLAKVTDVLTPEQLNSYQFTIKYPEIDPNGRGSLYAKQFQWAPPDAEHENYSIEINWRDGSVHQDLQIEKVGDRWFWATQIRDRETGQMLVNCKDDGFPYGPPGNRPCFPEMARPHKVAPSSKQNLTNNEVHKGSDSATGVVRTRNEILRSDIGDLISEGVKIRDRAPVYIGAPIRQPGKPDVLADWTAWTAKVDKFIQDNFDSAEAVKFKSLTDPDESLNLEIHAEIADLEDLLNRLASR